MSFVKGMLAIAKELERQTRLKVFQPIVHDLANYSYPLLREHAARPVREYGPYVRGLVRLGLWRSPLFWSYVLLLAALGPSRSDRVIERIRVMTKATPRLGSFSGGVAIPRSRTRNWRMPRTTTPESPNHGEDPR